MSDHCFISYSNADGLDFARQLVNKLEGGHPYIATWFDKDDLNPAEDWDEQIADAIKSCKCVLFVMTMDSVTPNSVCKQEWTYALRYKKPVVPIRLDLDIETPFSLGSRQWIDFSSNFDSGIAKLRQYIERLDSPEGIRLELKSRLKDAQRDLKRAKSQEEMLRIQTEIESLNANLRQQELIINNPKKAERQTRRNIDDGIQLERQSKPTTPIETKVKFVNPLPFNPPDYFQGREFEIQQLADFIKNDHQRILTIVGRGGGGKTALACYFLKALEKGCFPNDLGEAKADGIVYLSEIGSHKVNVPNIYADLLQLLPSETASRLETLYRQPKIPIGEKVRSLVEEFQNDPVVLLLDNFELFVDTETGNLIDSELKESLENILLAPQHSIKIIITTRVPARDLALVEPSRNIPLHLDEGLKSPYAENILRAMDSDGRAGFRDASDEQLSRARELTLGYPRALESLFAIISVDRYTSIDELLAVELPDTVVESLVGEAFSRLDANSQKVMQALAVYNRPVPPSAVDFLLQFHIPGINSAPILSRLVGMHFARREAGRYYLHPTDREYAFARIPVEENNKHIGKGARSLLWKKRALLLRAADYYAEARKPKEEWKKLEDLGVQLAEFDLRCMANDYDMATKVLRGFDYGYLLTWGHFHLALEVHLRVKDKILDVDLRMGNLNIVASAYNNIGNVADAIDLYMQGLRISQTQRDLSWEGVFLGNLGNAHQNLGNAYKAIEYYEQAIEIARKIGDKFNEANWLGNLSGPYRDLGKFEKAIESVEGSIALNHESNNSTGNGGNLSNLASTYMVLNDIQKGIEYCEQSLVVSRESGDRRSEAASLSNLGNAYTNLGDFDKALQYYELSLSIYREIRHLSGEAHILSSLADVQLELDEISLSIDYLNSAMIICKEIGDLSLEASILHSLGNTKFDRGEHEEAIKFYGLALQIADEIKYPGMQRDIYFSLSATHLMQNNVLLAQSEIMKAQEFNYPTDSYSSLYLLGLVYLRLGDTSLAAECFNKAMVDANKVIAKTSNLYAALDAKGLALCGLAIVDGVQYIEVAKEAFGLARKITTAAGIVKRTLRIFDELAKADRNNILAEVRHFIEGTE